MKKKLNGYLKFLIKKIIPYHLLFNLIFLFSCFSIQEKYNTIFKNYNSEIHLIINRVGNQKILSNSFYKDPLDIIVNNISKKNSCNRTCTLEENYNNITLIFEDPIVSFENMFDGLDNIKEVDLSNFDSSKVTSMAPMFRECKNIEKINFGNINTSSVINMERLFLSCTKLTSIDVFNFDTSQVTTMKSMFARCNSIKTIDTSNFNTSKVEIMFDMFAYCYELISVNVSNLNTSNCINFQGMFYECFKLKYLDLSNFIGSSANNLKAMFRNCSSLKYLNLNSFKINNDAEYSKSPGLPSDLVYCVPDTYTRNSLFGNYTISNCSDICFFEKIKIDISINECVEQCDSNKFEYKKICDNSCIEGYPVIYNQKKICLEEIQENFYYDFSDNVYKECYYKCKKCGELGNETINNCNECNNDFIFLNDTLAIKGNCYDKCNFYYYFNESNNYICTLDNSCPENYKLIKEKMKCISECYNDDQFKFEYENICYEKCPNGTISLEENKICTNIPTTILTLISTEMLTIIPTKILTLIPSEMLTIIPSKIISEMPAIIPPTMPTTIQERIMTTIPIHIYSYNNINEKMDSFKNFKTEKIYEIIRNGIIKTFPEEGEDILINTTENYTLQLTSLKNELDILKGNKNNTNKLSVIDLKECRDILIKSYNLNPETNLLILKYENSVSKVNDKSIQYEVYDPISAQRLNLSYCSSVSIDIYIPAEINKETQQLNEDLKSYGYNLFDKNDKFYTDICTPYKSKDGTDVLLSDRFNDFFKPNELSCQENCEYSNYLIDSQYLKCECNVVEQNEIELEEPEKFSAKSVVTSFINVLKYSNYKVLKCNKLVFKKNTFIENIGSILTIIYFLGFLSGLIIFFFKRFSYLKSEFQKLYENKIKEVKNNDNQNMNKNNIAIFYKDSVLKTNKKDSKYNINKRRLKGNFPPKKQLILRRSLYNKNKGKAKLLWDVIKEYVLQDSKGPLTNKEKNSKSQQPLEKIINQNSEIKNEKNENIAEENYDDYELNSLEYLLALEFDDRKFFRVYWSLLKREHLIIFTFFSWNDYNIFGIKLSKFFYLLCTDMTLNMFFFSDDSMHNLYKSGGKFNFFEQLFQMIISTLVSQLLQIFLNYLTMTDILYYQIKSLKKNEINKEKVIANLNCIKYKKNNFLYICIYIIFILLVCNFSFLCSI